MIVTVVGARPQFVKLFPLALAFKKVGIRNLVVHTGQHYDLNMSDLFFRELRMPEPDRNLGIGSARHGLQTGLMLAAIEDVLIETGPQCVVVLGDTNSTLAGGLAAAKLQLPVVHVEAGLRSFNRRMPEEINRIVVDRISSLLLCPSERARENLAAEGVTDGVAVIGDLMYDAVRLASAALDGGQEILDRHGVTPGHYVLATIHRAENTERASGLLEVLDGLDLSGYPVIVPLHPRSRLLLDQCDHRPGQNVSIVEPVGYFEMLVLEKHAHAIVTDSGGVQKEAYWLAVPCITVRGETEWVETVELGWNTLVPPKRGAIASAVRNAQRPKSWPQLYGAGDAATRACEAILARFKAVESGR